MSWTKQKPHKTILQDGRWRISTRPGKESPIIDAALFCWFDAVQSSACKKERSGIIPIHYSTIQYLRQTMSVCLVAGIDTGL